MMKVYYAPPSIYGRKVLAVLEEKNLEYTIEKMNFKAGDNQKDDYLKLNPNGEVPVLVDEEDVIYESTAIAEYLNDEYPDPPLLPEESIGRARVRMIDDFCDLHFFPHVRNSFVKKFLRNEELTGEDKATAAALLKRIEDYLGKNEFVAGDMFTFADCAVMAAFASLEGLGWGDLLSSSPSIKKYADKLKKRPSFKAASLFSFEPAKA